MIDTIERPSVEKAIAPAKQWQNWYMVVIGYRSNDVRRYRPTGERIRAPRVWPSKEIAEQKANDYCAPIGSALDEGKLEYLGAFPVSP